MRGMISKAEADRMIKLILRYGPLSSFKATAEKLVTLTANDKKNRSGQLSFILPVKIGEVAIVRDVTREEMKAAAEWTLALMREQNGASSKTAVTKKTR
jgi:3-dehydroquinate synthase